MPSLPLRSSALTLVAALAALAAPVLAVADPAAAATRYASATSSLESGPCGADAPCALAHAIGGASSGDEVVVAPGDYFLTAALDPPSGLNVHGVAGEARPRLVGSPDLGDAVIDATGDTFSHLYVESLAGDEEALVLHSGTGDDLVLVGVHGSAVKVRGSSPTTLLRNSVARAFGSDDAVVLQDGGSPAGATDLRNVTAISAGGAGVRSKMQRGTATIGNVIARGGAGDVLPAPTGPGTAFNAFSSDFRASSATAAATGGNIASDPLFADAADGDFRLSAGSPAIDAGTTDSLVGGTDPDGHPRVLGAAPDMGAFEGAASGTATTLAVAVPWPPPAAGAGDAPLGSLPLSDPVQALVLPPPLPARTVSVAPASGRVTVRRPGARGFVRLRAGASLPVGATVDTRAGTVRLVSARDASGTPQTGLFRGGVFQVRQSRRSGLVTQLVLRGGNFAVCRAQKVRHGKRRRPRVIRTLWGRDHGGRFQTNGRFAAALVRGTTWETVDRCDGTLVRVTQGKVLVRTATGRRVLVRAGHAFLVRPRPRRR